MALLLQAELLNRVPAPKTWVKKSLSRRSFKLDNQAPSFTALLVAMARRKEDPWGLKLIASLEGYVERYDRHIQGYALRQGIPLLAHIPLEDKHHRLMRHVASTYYDAFYAGRVFFADQCIAAWREQNRAAGKKSVILIPGAGFDSKALRYDRGDDLFIVEFDMPQTQALKQTALENVTGTRALPGVAYIPVDYTRPGESRRQLQKALALVEAYFPESSLEETAFFVSLEGISYYLDRASNQNLFAELMDALPVGTQCFVDWYQGSRWNPNQHPYGRFLHALGEPVQYLPIDYAGEVLQPLAGDGKAFREIKRANRADVATQYVAMQSGKAASWLAEDAFGQFSQFSLVELIAIDH
jgi:O-methyltransferase involved in polyketide biosynthesis